MDKVVLESLEIRIPKQRGSLVQCEDPKFATKLTNVQSISNVLDSRERYRKSLRQKIFLI